MKGKQNKNMGIIRIWSIFVDEGEVEEICGSGDTWQGMNGGKMKGAGNGGPIGSQSHHTNLVGLPSPPLGPPHFLPHSLLFCPLDIYILPMLVMNKRKNWWNISLRKIYYSKQLKFGLAVSYEYYTIEEISPSLFEIFSFNLDSNP